MPRSVLPCLLALVLSGLTAGCSSSHRPAATFDEALSLYESGHYAAARRTAERVASAGPPHDRAPASYLAGVSAYQLGAYADAEPHLLAAASGTDRTTAGRARAQLGLIRMQQRRPDEAARLFEEASYHLEGDDARQAARHASLAHEAAGHPELARRWSDKASGLRTSAVSPSHHPAPTVAALGGGTFTLQVGAFSDRARAERAARDAEPVASQYALGEVRITERRGPAGRTLHLVQVGQFTTHKAAARARTRMGRLDYIVASVVGP